MMLKRKFAMMMAAAMMVGTLAGCGAGKSGDGSGADAGSNEKLVVYTNSGGDGRQEWLTEKAAEAGFNIEVVNMGGGDLLNRLIAEKNNTQADVVFGMTAVDFATLKDEGLLVQYTPDWAYKVDKSLGDSEGYYYPIVTQPLVMMYNTDLENPPSDIIDLANPEYEDKFFVGGLGGGTPKNLYASILVRYQDPNGEYGISDEGWEIAKNYLQNANIIVDGEDFIGDVISGKTPITAMWGSGVIQNQNERDYKFGIVCPKIGVPYIAEQVGITTKDENTELEEEFVNWFGSAELQSAWSEEFGTIPANTDSLANVSDDIKEFMNTVHSQEIDWTFVAENINQWVEKAELEFMN